MKLRDDIAARLAEIRTRRPEPRPPRYDEVFVEGVAELFGAFSGAAEQMEQAGAALDAVGEQARQVDALLGPWLVSPDGERRRWCRDAPLGGVVWEDADGVERVCSRREWDGWRRTAREET